MTNFNDLIADLTRENLLDESNNLSSTKPNESNNSLEFELQNYPTPDLLTNTEIYEVKLPDFSFLKPEIDREINENQIKNVFPAQDQTITTQTTQNLIKYKTSRSRHKRASRRGKYCPTCLIKISQFSLYCHCCRQRVVSDLYYYSLIMLSTVIFVVLAWVIITSKSYN